jgi:hypothetical protein
LAATLRDVLDNSVKPNVRQWFDRWGIPILVFALAFLPRAIYPVTRAWLWYMRSIRFSDAVLTKTWTETYQQYHPGVTTMWLSGIGLKLFAWQRGLTSEQLLGVSPAKPGSCDAAVTAGVLPLAFVIAVCIVWIYVLLEYITDQRTALAGSVLLALDPFFITYSKEIHLNALLTVFMLMSALFLFNHLARETRSHLILSGAFAGLALLTKTPSVFLLPYTVLALVAYRLMASASLRSAIHRLWLDLGKLLIWGGVAAVVFVALWPAMWVEPLNVLRGIGEGIFFHVNTTHENPVFFNKRIVDDPGFLFYLATIAWKTTLITLPMACAAPVLALLKLRQGKHNWITWLLVAYAVSFAAQMGLGSWKQVSYVVPVVAALDILAALGLVQSVKAIGGVRWRRKRRLDDLCPWLPTALIGLTLVLQAGITLSRHPYYGTHHNALLGGSRVAQHILPLQDQGEGLDLAAKYLNTQPHAQRSGAWIQSRSSLTFKNKFVGLTSQVRDPRATYRVYYVNQVMRHLGGEEWKQAWETDRQTTPLWTIAFDGIPYVWVYGTPPEEPAAGSPEYKVDYQVGDHIKLRGFRRSPDPLSPGDMLTVVLIWESDGEVEENYTVFCHVLSAGQELVAQHDGRPVSEIRPTPSWRAGEVIQDSHQVFLSDDLAPGEYELSVGMYELRTMERAPIYDKPGQRLLEDRVVLDSIHIK